MASATGQKGYALVHRALTSLAHVFSIDARGLGRSRKNYRALLAVGAGAF